jgi:hypothetical protein
MAEVESDTFISRSQKIIQNFNDNLNKSGNLSKLIKTELEKCVIDLEKLINEQNSLINKQKILIENEFKMQSERHIDIINNVNKRLENIENNFVNKSYSQVVSNHSMNLNKNERHVVVIRPSDKNKTSIETENEIKNIIKPNVLKINIKSKRQISRGGVLIECETKDECNRISETIRSKSRQINVEKEKKSKPRIVIKNFDQNIEENNLIQLIRDFNYEIDEYLVDLTPENIENEIKIKFKFRRHNPRDGDKYCLELSPNMRKIIMKTKRLFIDWKSYPIEDSIPIIRCYKCHGFGHKSTECKQTQNICGHCMGAHESKECQTDRSHSKCVNCIKHNKKSNSRVNQNINHSSYSYSCPSLIRIRNIITSRIQYE